MSYILVQCIIPLVNIRNDHEYYLLFVFVDIFDLGFCNIANNKTYILF